MRYPSCSSENPSDAKSCQVCGQSPEDVYPHCSMLNSPDARFYRNCGKRLAAVPSSPSAVAPSNRLTAFYRRSSAPLQANLSAAGDQRDGERQLVTIFFPDIVNYTPLSEKFDPELAVDHSFRPSSHCATLSQGMLVRDW